MQMFWRSEVTCVVPRPSRTDAGRGFRSVTPLALSRPRLTCADAPNPAGGAAGTRLQPENKIKSDKLEERCAWTFQTPLSTWSRVDEENLTQVPYELDRQENRDLERSDEHQSCDRIFSWNHEDSTFITDLTGSFFLCSCVLDYVSRKIISEALQ